MNAALFGIVMLTGSVLYIGQLSVLVGNREIVRIIHVYCGLAIPVAFLVALVAALGRALRRDFARINRWTTRRQALVPHARPRPGRPARQVQRRARSSTPRSSSRATLVMVGDRERS